MQRVVNVSKRVAGRSKRIVRNLRHPLKTNWVELALPPNLYARVRRTVDDKRQINTDFYIPSPLRRYSHYRFGYLGSDDLFKEVAQSYPADEPNYQRLAALGIEFLLVDYKRRPGRAKLARTLKAIEEHKEQGVPVIVRLYRLDPTEQRLAQAADYLLSTSAVLATPAAELGQVIELEPVINPFVYNPIGWHYQPPHELTLPFEGNSKPHHRLARQLTKQQWPASPLDADNLKIPPQRYWAAVLVRELFNNEESYHRTRLRLAAAGLPVISVNDGPERYQLPKELFPVVKHLEAAVNLLGKLREPRQREQLSVQQRRYVHLNHTPLNNFETVVRALGLPVRPAASVSVLMCTNRRDFLADAVANVAKQSYPGPIELVLVLHGGAKSFDLAAVEKLAGNLPKRFTHKIITKGASTLFGEALNAGLDVASGELITKMDDDDFYGEHHLSDLVIAHRYSGASVVGKWAHHIKLSGSGRLVAWQTGRMERYGTHLPGGTIMMATDDLRRFRFGRVSRGIDSELFRRLEARGGKLYSTHRYNYVRLRHDQHTYVRDEDEFVKESTEIFEDGDIELGFI